ncbi:SDR family oxidoreductase [Streptomyces sp. OF3]|uniref:SDR family oxidoreductase n=2 Tax=Streptomyces alkaliterrae TaxID=2213162 RepID=A0A5P0YYF0_9ACTN|nr:SDR family oxidoreductase [Streptomyces alkaliterrae]MBB1257543.1 SDR family oxidoreductase [Streptomyces alkaliterrae]MQS04567.1 SDR family oxidoreductase [Streptomyces alkaliterrae]
MLRGAAAGAGAVGALGLLGSATATAAAPAAATTGVRTRSRRFAGKVVLITGGTSGIGEATARGFASAGAKVAFCGRRTERGRAVERDIRRSGGEATYLPADVRVPAEVKRFVDRSVERYGRLDIAFNNAGIQVQKPLHETSVAEWDDTTDTNARGVFLAMKYQIPHLLAGGGGQIIVNSSVGAVVGRPGLSLYQSSKQAVLALVKSAALEYGSRGVRVNAVLPGITDTAMIRPPGLDDATWERAKTALGKLNVDGLGTVADPEHIATAVLAMAGDEFGYLTGVALPVDGGIAAGRRMLLPES